MRKQEGGESIYLGVDSTQVCIFKEGNKVGLNGFLESTDGRGLEAKVGLEILGDLSDKTLEWEFSDQELSRLLVTSRATVPGLYLCGFSTPLQYKSEY